jgi:hypothetical protein
LGDLGVDESIILKWTLKNQGMRMWAGFIWLTIETNCRLYEDVWIP